MKSLVLTSLLFLASSQLFAADVWNQKSNLPAEGRHRTTGFSIGNKGYLGLGHYNSGPNGNIAKADIWEYDPTNDSWTQKADYGGGATYGATAFTIGQFAYVGAHVYGSAEFYKFDPIANIWTQITSSPEGASDHVSFSLNGKGYFITTSSYYQYKPQNDAWALMGSNPSSVGAWSNAFSIGEKGYLLTTNGVLYEYKEITNTWTFRTNFPGDAVGGWSNFIANGKAYIFSGYIAYLNPTSRQLWELNITQYEIRHNTTEQTITIYSQKSDAPNVFYICNLNGQVILNLSTVSINESIDISGIESGLYICVLIDSKNNITSKKIAF
jgi:N-acetylneuraminic acid mutarotase